jgi:hypothetical protein
VQLIQILGIRLFAKMINVSFACRRLLPNASAGTMVHRSRIASSRWHRVSRVIGASEGSRDLGRLCAEDRRRPSNAVMLAQRPGPA